MGVAGLWDILRPAARTRSLTELALMEGFEANPGGVRGFRIGVDASIWFFHANYGKEGENPELRTLFFRCATLMRSTFLPLFVFDGPKRPNVKRGKRINPNSHKLTTGMKAIIESFGFEWRTAPGEAEAELAYLNRIGVIDGILSDDVDNFLFGATMVIRNSSQTLSGNRANPALNSAGKGDKNHTMVYRLQDITDRPEISLTRGGMILIGLLSGGDYQQGGLNRCGTVTAHGLARCGLGDTLFQAAVNLTREQLPAFLLNWRNELRHELRTDSQGHIGRKQPSLAKSVPDDFPDIDILLSYTNPITSESMGRSEGNLKLTWDKEPDLGALAATCEFNFEWGYKEAIVKRFRTVIWPPAILRILRRAVLDADAKAQRSASALPVTPQKKCRPSPTPIGTPSKMITKHFSSLTLNSPSLSHDDDERLIVKIHSTRNHASTDGILEYRLEIAPAQLVRLAESGIKGIRRPEDVDEWVDEEEDDDNGGGKGGRKKQPPDPDSRLRVWMPAAIVRIVEPDLVEEYEQIQHRKREIKAAKGRAKAAGERSSARGTDGRDEDEESASSGSELPTLKPVGPKVKKRTDVQKTAQNGARDIRNDLKTAFAVVKPRNYTKAKPISTPPKLSVVKPRKFPSFVELSDDSDTQPVQWVPQQPSVPIRHNSRRRPPAALSDDSDNLPLAPGSSQLTSSHSKPSRQFKSVYYPVSKPEVVEIASNLLKVPEHIPTNVRSNEAVIAIEAPPVVRAACQLLRPQAFPMSLNDMFGSDDQLKHFEEPPVAKPKHARKKAVSSSGSDSHQTRLKKSPRKSVDHISPRFRRTVTYLSTDDENDEVKVVRRAGSPSPSTSRLTRAMSSPRSLNQARVIEISSDSDVPTSNSRLTNLPLIVAKARSTGGPAYIQPKPKKMALRHADLNTVIDLT